MVQPHAGALRQVSRRECEMVSSRMKRAFSAWQVRWSNRDTAELLRHRGCDKYDELETIDAYDILYKHAKALVELFAVRGSVTSSAVACVLETLCRIELGVTLEEVKNGEE